MTVQPEPGKICGSPNCGTCWKMRHFGHDISWRHEDGSLYSATCRDCGETYQRGSVETAAAGEAVKTDAMDLSSWTHAPHRIAVDAKGYVWRVFDDGMWSMASTNPDNSPIPHPVTFYEPVSSREAVEDEAHEIVGEPELLRLSESIGAGEPVLIFEVVQATLAVLRRLRPVVSSPVQVDGERPTLAELHARYLTAREHTLSTDGMDRDAAIEAQALYVLGEASELHAACKHGTGGWGGTAKHWRCEIADVVLAAVSLANILGVTVEDCIAEKTEEDRGRG